MPKSKFPLATNASSMSQRKKSSSLFAKLGCFAFLLFFALGAYFLASGSRHPLSDVGYEVRGEVVWKSTTLLGKTEIKYRYRPLSQQDSITKTESSYFFPMKDYKDKKRAWKRRHKKATR